MRRSSLGGIVAAATIVLCVGAAAPVPPPVTEVATMRASVTSEGYANALPTLALRGDRAAASGPALRHSRCPSAIRGTTAGAPGKISSGGVAGTTSADLAAFAKRFNAIRVARCLPPIPFRNIRYSACMEKRLFWMAEDPSTDPASAWGHIGSRRSDGVPSVGCDGNLAGGSGVTGASVADRWWASSSHRASLYRPTVKGSMANTCVYFAMTHGGIPNEPSSFTRAAARWVTCP